MTSIIVSLTTMAILLLLSGLISGSEVAFFSLSPSILKDLRSSEEKKQQRIIFLIDQPKQLLATILIANNFINVAIVILSSYITTLLLPPGLSNLESFAIQVVAVTFIILLLGEVIPKIYASKKPLFLANLMSLPLFVLNRVFKGIMLSTVLVKLGSIADKYIKKRKTNDTVNELEQALDLTINEESIDAQEKKILQGIVKFGNKEVTQIMTSRVDVMALDIETSFKELRNFFLEVGHSRIPVFKESFDHVEGVLYIKDLLPYLDKETFDWKTKVRKPFFVPENKKIDDLLKEFQTSKVHMAIVVDEYGGTSGVVTLEDVLEEIVGDISDEFDNDDLVYTKIDDNNYIFEGKTLLVDLYKVVKIDEELFEKNKGEADTLAGLLLEISGKIPVKNEKIKLNKYLFTIEAADKRRIKRVKLTLNEK